MTIGRKDKRRLLSLFNEALSPEWQSAEEMFVATPGLPRNTAKLQTIVRTKQRETDRLVLSLRGVDSVIDRDQTMYFRRKPLTRVVYCPLSMEKP